MRTSTVTFCSDYIEIVRAFDRARESFEVSRHFYEAVGISGDIDDKEDFGVSTKGAPRLVPFFDAIKASVSDALAAMDKHREYKAFFDAMDLSSAIADEDDLGDGVTGADFKAVVDAMEALNGYLDVEGHYGCLCPLRFTGKRLSESDHATWKVGVTGAQFKAAITSMGALSDFLTAADAALPVVGEGKVQVVGEVVVRSPTTSYYARIAKLL